MFTPTFSPAGLMNQPDMVYNPAIGGYITQAEANDPSSAYVRDWYGKPMTGGDPTANQAMRTYFDWLRSLPVTYGVNPGQAPKPLNWTPSSPVQTVGQLNPNLGNFGGARPGAGAGVSRAGALARIGR